jgi:hypothetical protein
LAGSTNEWFTLLVFIPPRGFAHKHQIRLGVARAKDNMRTSGVEAAFRTILYGSFEAL